jgi:hypothetical protein
MRRPRFGRSGICLGLLCAAALVAPAHASAFRCVDREPAATGETTVIDASGVQEDESGRETGNSTALGASIDMFLGRYDGLIDVTTLVYNIVRQEGGTRTQVRGSGGNGEAEFKPSTPGTYLISATFMSWDCTAGPGTESQPRGPYTTPQITRNVVEGDAPGSRYTAALIPQRFLPRGMPFGSAVLGNYARCHQGSGSRKPLTTIARYTLDGSKPTRRSPSARVTAPVGCGQENDEKHVHKQQRHGAWGRVRLDNSEGSKASVIVTPGHRLRVWLELRQGHRILSAIRARSRERGGRQGWVADKGSCAGAPGGCSRLHQDPHALVL